MTQPTPELDQEPQPEPLQSIELASGGGLLLGTRTHHAQPVISHEQWRESRAQRAAPLLLPRGGDVAH